MIKAKKDRKSSAYNDALKVLLHNKYPKTVFNVVGAG
jgi:hypothetical protein